MNTQNLKELLNKTAMPLNQYNDLDPLIDQIGDAHYVLLGEASHGTHEYYMWRAEITKRLIQEKGFSFVAVEGDWPDCYRVNKYVKGSSNSGKSAFEVLNRFQRWPTWMWANREVESFVEWLKIYNKGTIQKVGFYGLDVYSLWESLYAIIDYLKTHDPDAVKAAYHAFQCFDPYGYDVHEYARATALVPESCQKEVTALLTEIMNRTITADTDEAESTFNVQQNAYVLQGAEEYYRTMIYGGADSWNLRDTHMTETFDRLMNFYSEQENGNEPKGVVWAHNTHVGDARFTDMTLVGEHNIGQLVREQHADEGVVLVGFGSYHGSVIAGKSWDARMEQMRVPEAISGSFEQLMHEAVGKDSLFLYDEHIRGTSDFTEPLGHRAIGVVYDPSREYGNYVPSIIPHRYDAFLYIDTTRALQPLHMKEPPDYEIPETYPSGL